MKDLLQSGVEILTLGQYLRPTKGHLPVKSFPTPEKYQEWKKIGEDLGFKYVASSPLVRSSYKAGGILDRLPRDRNRVLYEEFDPRQECFKTLIFLTTFFSLLRVVPSYSLLCVSLNKTNHYL